MQDLTVQIPFIDNEADLLKMGFDKKVSYDKEDDSDPFPTVKTIDYKRILNDDEDSMITISLFFESEDGESFHPVSTITQLEIYNQSGCIDVKVKSIQDIENLYALITGNSIYDFERLSEVAVG